RDFIENRYVRIAPDSEYDALKIHREYAHILSQMEKENTLAQDLYSDNVKLFQQISSGALVLNASLEQIQEMVKKFELSKRLSQNVIKNIELLEGWPLDKQYSIFLHMSNGKTSFEQSLKGKKVLMARITSIEGYLSAAPRSNQAMLVENTGGIDFDTSEMTAQTSGKGLDIQIKDSLGDIDPAMIQGIIPVNIRLTPITNIGVLFGKADGDKESSDEDMNLSTAILNKLKNYV
ncbi:MAG: hypothetical protein COW13_03290, partial [Candidatus Omnitrophica bacterium CG12_big_fil_rev_8_21_14_0_65_50_5]